MTPLHFFLLLIAALLLVAVFNWRKRFKDLKEFQVEQAQKAAARRARLGPDFKTGSGPPELALALFGPPEDYMNDGINHKMSTAELDAALEERDKLVLEKLPIGASRFGGVPDLPPEVSWPMFEGRKLPFLAQIDLATLPKSILPSEGWLYVFGLSDNIHDGTPLAVVHHNGARAHLVRRTRPAKDEMWPDWTGNHVYTTVPLKSASTDGWESQDGEFFGNFAEDESGAGAIADAAELSGDDWITLLAISSTGSMMWSDCGWFHIVIRRQDLLKHDFSKVCATLSHVG